MGSSKSFAIYKLLWVQLCLFTQFCALSSFQACNVWNCCCLDRVFNNLCLIMPEAKYLFFFHLALLFVLLLLDCLSFSFIGLA